MKYKDKVFSPSTNILRDLDSNIDYIVTNTSTNVFNEIADNFGNGIRSYYIVGNYGTGKSSFLWALEKTLNNNTNYFAKRSKNKFGINEFETLILVGEYGSFFEAIAEKIYTGRKKEIKARDVLDALKAKLLSLKKEKKGLLFIVDEFGKYLEYAALNNPSFEIYFIQQLAELINDFNFNALFVTTLHQDFNTYARELTKSQRNEWEKVKGRLKEIPFNEQIEQLLLLASERICKFDNSNKPKDKVFKESCEIANKLNAFSIANVNDPKVACKLYPLDSISASILTLALQKYGQSERSLFTFIESEDSFSLKNFDSKNNPFFNISCVYDYLIHNFFSFLISKDNPDYTQWSSIKSALERIEILAPEDYKNSAKIVKTIGLLNIFAKKSAKIDRKFLDEYGKYSLSIIEVDELVKKLEQRKIIRYLDFASKFILFEGTDLDIDLAIKDAANKIDKIINVVPYLKKYFNYEIPAKEFFYEYGTPRIFKFELSEEPKTDLIPQYDIDGYINLVFSDNLSETIFEDKSIYKGESILYGYFKKTEEIRDILFQINTLIKVKDDNIDDKVALKELELLLTYYTERLKTHVIDSIHSSDNSISWYFNGKDVSIKIYDRKSLNKFLTFICKTVYSKTVVYKNEMINRTKLSSSINTAKKYFFTHFLANNNDKEFGFEKESYPPEKTIFLSLFCETGIYNSFKGQYSFSEPSNDSFRILWNECENFIESTKNTPRSISDLYKILLQKPFKLKKGFLEFWIPAFLYIKRTDFVLYDKEVFVPDFILEVIELINKAPNNFSIKAFNLEGVRLDLFNKYREMVGREKDETISSKSFIDLIKPFLTFYRQLNDYSKNTNRISKTTAAFREVIVNASDPEKIFFEDFPIALGYDVVQLRENYLLLEKFMGDLKSSIQELRICFDNLAERILNYLSNTLYGEELGFYDFKLKLTNRYSSMKEYMLLPYQKSFLTRVRSDIDNKSAWLSSLVFAVLNKHLDSITDSEEEVVYDKLKAVLHELDNLSKFSELKIDTSKEELSKVEISAVGEESKTFIFTYPKSRNNKIDQLYNNIKSILTKDSNLNKAAIIKLLKDSINE